MSSILDEEVEIDGVMYSYRCDICWQELDETDIQFKPCNRCHLQVCLFCFNKHTNRKESYSKTCPKCREPIDMEQIMKQNMTAPSKSRNTLAKKLLLSKRITTSNTAPGATTSHKKRKRKKSNKDSSTYPDRDHAHSHTVDIDEEIPKTDWKNYLKGRFISRDSIIVAPVIAKFNNEEAISDNFKVYGRITRINMWDDESAHIMYDKQYFADALVDRIQDVAVRYQGQFGLMSAKYHFRRPCEEFMDPDRRCPMQCRKFHGPYYKLDFIPLDQYLDEEARDQWIHDRRKHVSGIVKARYKKFRKKFMDGVPLPIVGETKEDYNNHTTKPHKKRSDHNEYSYGYNGHEEDYENHNNEEHPSYTTYNANNTANINEYYPPTTTYNGGRYRYNPRYNTTKERERNPIGDRNKNAITLKYTAMGKANKLLALDDSLQKHMRGKPHQPLPPSRAPPSPPYNTTANTTNNADDGGHSVQSESTTSTTANNLDSQSNSGSVGSGKRTRPPIHHTTSAQMRGFMATHPNLNLNININTMQFNEDAQSKAAKVKSLMDTVPMMSKIQRAKSEDHILERSETMQHNNGHNRGDTYYVKGAYSASSSQLPHVPPSHQQQSNKGLTDKYSHSSSNLRTLDEGTSPKKQNHKLRTVDLLKSLKKKKRKQRNNIKPPLVPQLPTVQPLPHPTMSTFKPHHHNGGNNLMPVNMNMNVNGPPPMVPNMGPVMNLNGINAMNINMNLHSLNGGAHTQTMPPPFHPFHPTHPLSAPPPHVHTAGYGAPHPHPLDTTAKPFKPPRMTSVLAKKSKLNANAASYKPLNSPTKPHQPQQPRQQFKLPKMRNNHHTNNIKSFDIRNLGPLIADNDILNKGDDKEYAYDFSAALDDTHLDLNGTNTHDTNHHIQKPSDHLESDKGGGSGKKEEKKKVKIEEEEEDEAAYCYTASSDDSSDAEYDYKQKWTQHTLWDKVCDVVKDQRQQTSGNDEDNSVWCNWQNIRKLLKHKMSFADWNYVKEMKLVKKVKAKFRMEFEKVNSDREKENEVLATLLVKQSLRTREAKGFANLVFEECGVIDLDLRVGDIRNYMTDLLTQNTTAVPSQYDTTIVAELGQILNVYQAWIDAKNLDKKGDRERSVTTTQELETTPKLMHNDNDNNNGNNNEEEEHIKDMMALQEPLFGVPFQLHHEENESLLGAHNSNDHASDFYSRLLDEVQQKAVFEHEDGGSNPKDLVMDYIGFNEYKEERGPPLKKEDDTLCLHHPQEGEDEKQNEKEVKAKEKEIEANVEKETEYDDAVYDYEYSDDTEEDEPMEPTQKEIQKKINVEKETEKESDLIEEVRAYDEDEDAALYQYDDEDEDEDDVKQDHNGNGAIFSRCHSPPPRHRKEEDENEMEHNAERMENEREREGEEEAMAMMMNDGMREDMMHNNDMIAMDGMDASDRHYYNARYPPRRGRYGRNNDKYHYQRYSVKNNKNILNNPVKMEWKKKENKESTDTNNENEDK